ncbi:ArsR/SmtB family transcription factor [Kribbella solani]|uniref:ArsR/SmtB family transcription factor n=1 Tax=Kribbella solani TaxID=236067 RepID=UPI0029A91DCE|nr:winged helix-turn-helix domain-containing protein [Kribbella solani]MDX2967745.1 winged helix-turn-helix domain-containing protein [Kribbella solani]
MAKQQRVVVISDPQAIRALAHPARQQVIDELYNGRVLTATECAELAGLTPSAMSYHLRALEKWGIIERAEETADGRERPWRSKAASLRIDSTSAGAGRLAGQAIMRTAVDRVLAQFEELSDEDPWDDVSMMSRSRLWLTHDEAVRFGQELSELVDRYKQHRTQSDHPAGTRAVGSLYAVVPLGKPAEDS